jgi:lipopolysaccharide export system permease protein
LLKLDRYVLRQFFLAAVVSLAGFIIIYVAIDMMEKLDKFLDKKVPGLIVLEYYANFVPQILTLIMPVGLLLGSLFATGKMSTQNEIIAMRSAGMSLYRFMAPFILAAIAISGFAIYFNGWVLPRANRRLYEIQREHVKENLLSNAQFNLHMQESANTILIMQDFLVKEARGNRVSIQTFDTRQKTRLVKRIDAPSMQWDSTKKLWELNGGVERVFPSTSAKAIASPLPVGAKNDQPERIKPLVGNDRFVKLTITPIELRERQLRYDELTTPELKRRIDAAKRAGQQTARDEVDYYAKYAMPFTSLIVVLFGVPFASKKKRGGLSFEFAIAIFVSFMFLTFTKVSYTFGYSGQIPPLLTAWLANGVFFLAALAVIWKAQK